MALSPASSHGAADAAAPLTLTGTSDTQQLTVVGVTDQGSAILEIRDPVRGLVMSMDAFGDFFANGGGQVGGVFDDVQLKVLGNGAQTKNLVQFNVGGVQSLITKEGAYATRLHAAPADASLLAGDCALWFDQTNGAAKLMIKAKQADGSVKTAAIALA